MRAIQVTDQAVTIRLSGEELPDGGDLAGLVRRALTSAGLTPWIETEAECFTAGAETLIIARPGMARRPAFFFEDLEALLAGALCCPAGESDLYAAAGGYILAAAPAIIRPGLYEFGVPVPLSPDREAHLREQGRLIAADRAVADMRRLFSTEPM